MVYNAGPRSVAKLQYAVMRQYLAVFEEQVIARYWDEDTFVRVGFERFLGSLDRFAGRLLDGDELAADLREQEDTCSEPAAGASAIDVTFTLPAEVQADTVALCGEFNEWSAEHVPLERGTDGTWRATVALEPGRSYRYRYLLDGNRWENAWQADRYVPNPYGGTDSVVMVG